MRTTYQCRANPLSKDAARQRGDGRRQALIRLLGTPPLGIVAQQDGGVIPDPLRVRELGRSGILFFARG